MSKILKRGQRKVSLVKFSICANIFDRIFGQICQHQSKLFTWEFKQKLVFSIAPRSRGHVRDGKGESKESRRGDLVKNFGVQKQGHK